MQLAKRKQRMAGMTIGTVTFYCVDGPCKGQTFRIPIDKKSVSITTPEDPFYSYAVYKVSGHVTHLNELVGIHVNSIERGKEK
jgi:hypothetical protein